MSSMNLQTKKKDTSLKAKLSSTKMKERFNDIFKDDVKAGQFLASLSSAVSSNPLLSRCDPNEVIVCAGIAASLNLDVNPNLGFSAIIPFNKMDYNTGIKTPHPQFQIMTRGYIQLALRTGQYQALNVTEVYEDELLGVNYITGEVKFNEKGTTQRRVGDESKIVGYCAYMKLVNGFEHYEYWDIEKIYNHAKTYVPSYQYDLRDNKKSSLWSTNFPAMAKKTVLKMMLKSWGILSTQLQKALLADDATGEKDGFFEYAVDITTDKDSTVSNVEDPKIQNKQQKAPAMQQSVPQDNFSDIDFKESGI